VQVSPTPLLIHSVMGVGTNIFPMKVGPGRIVALHHRSSTSYQIR
jgi:hypothetical protein